MVNRWSWTHRATTRPRPLPSVGRLPLLRFSELTTVCLANPNGVHEISIFKHWKNNNSKQKKSKPTATKKAPKKTSAKIARAWPSCSSCCRRSKSWSRSFRRDSISCATGTIHRCWRYWVGYIILALGHLTCGIDGLFSSMIYLVKKLGLSIANCLIARGYMEIPNFPILGGLYNSWDYLK